MGVGGCFPGGSAVKSLPANAGDTRDMGSIPAWVGKIPWRRKWQPTAAFLPGQSRWTEEPGGPQSVGSQRAGMTADRATVRADLQCCTTALALLTTVQGGLPLGRCLQKPQASTCPKGALKECGLVLTVQVLSSLRFWSLSPEVIRA